MAPPYNMFENSGGRGAEDSSAAVFRALRAGGDTHVWWWRQPLRTDPADLALLNTEEFRQALCLHSERDAAAYVHTRATARRAIGELLDVAPEDVDIEKPLCPVCGDPGHGPTRLSRPDVPLAISLARTGGHTVLAVGTGATIGVAAERLRPVRQDVLAESWLTADEALHLLELPRGAARDEVFYRCWARKEAVLRALGHVPDGVRPDQIESYPATTDTVLMHCPGTPGTPGTPGEPHPDGRTAWVVRDLALSGRAAAAVAQPAGTEPACGPVRTHLPGGTARPFPGAP
ncbi:4'-phosphopantetheinyl transferase family protein [Streptomyces sp. NPDC056452]|uniref:4'-phosphopantetheinyl transferase family protein n=1 Tax=Streptomyces sp. NPDC056452 TaxID=3345821 RepID=UPI0036D04470